MKANGDFSKIQKQQLLDDNNLFGGNELNPDYYARKKKLLQSFEKILKESKYTFLADWQITEDQST